MADSLNQRSPVAKIGWLIPVLMVAWLAFLFLPVQKPEPPPVAPTRIIAKQASKLQLAGLPDNVDFEELPEIFAIWADQAEWKDNRTRFAYWHPGSKNYGYFLEATRVEGGFRFREIPEPKVNDAETYWDESLGEECPIRFLRSVRIVAPVVRPPDVPDSVRPVPTNEDSKIVPVESKPKP